MTQEITQSIARSAHRFFSGTLLSRISGLCRDIIMAACFGSHATIAAFLVAFRLSNCLRRLFGEGALHAAFVPFFEEKRKLSNQEGALFFRNISLSLSLGLLSVTLVVELVLHGLLFFVDLSSSNRELIFLTALLFPGLIFICHAALNTSLLQCRGIYFVPAVSPVAFNGVWIVSMLLLKGMNPERAMPYLSLGVVVAYISQWLMTHFQAYSFVKEHLSFSLFRGILQAYRAIASIKKPLFLGVIGVAATQINNALDPLFARYADLKGPAYLWYALRIQQIPLAFFGVALAAALLPSLSRAYQNNDVILAKTLLSFSIKRVIVLMLPFSFVLLIMGPNIINILFSRGAFDAESSLNSCYCLWGYAPALLPSALVMITAPVFYAQNRYKITTQATLLAVGMNIGLNALFIFVWDFGASSVAFATGISAWFHSIFLLYHLNYRDKKCVILFSKLLIACLLITSLLLYLPYPRYINGRVFIEPFLALLSPSSFINHLTACCYQITIFFGVLLIFSKLFKIEEILNFFKKETKGA